MAASSPRRERGPWQSRLSRRAATIAPPRDAIGTAMTALRESREAIVEIDGQLDECLDHIHDPKKPLAADLPSRMARSTRRAGAALAGLALVSGVTATSDLF